MNSEKMVMGEAPDQPKSNKKAIIAIILACVIIIAIALFVKIQSTKTIPGKDETTTVPTQKKDNQDTSKNVGTTGNSMEITPAANNKVSEDNIPNTNNSSIKNNATTKVETKVKESPSGNSNEYQVKAGESLWSIAGNSTLLNNPYKWIAIYKANKSKIKNPDLIFPGQKFNIPNN